MGFVLLRRMRERRMVEVMSKKHFIALADELRCEREHFVLNYGQAAFDAMFCRSQNGRFDTDRFRGYIAGTCGPNGGAVKCR